MKRYDQGRPSSAEIALVTASTRITLSTRRHFGVSASKCQNRMLPIAKIVATTATSNQESMAGCRRQGVGTLPTGIAEAPGDDRILLMRANSCQVAVLCTVLATLVVPPSPAGAQSDIAFPPSVYAERRTRLANTVGESVIVIPGRYLINPGDGLVKQDPTFWYLTGVESPYAILVMRVGAPNAPAPRVRSYLFLPTSYQFAGGQLPMLDDGFRRAVWNRPRRRLVPGPESARLTLVDAAIPVDSFVPRFREIAQGRDDGLRARRIRPVRATRSHGAAVDRATTLRAGCHVGPRSDDRERRAGGRTDAAHQGRPRDRRPSPFGPDSATGMREAMARCGPA